MFSPSIMGLCYTSHGTHFGVLSQTVAIRTAFYDATDLNLVEEHEYNQFVSKVADARIGYVDQNGELLLPELDPELFADDDSRETYNRYDATEPEPVGEPGPIPDSNEHIERYIRWLKDAPAEYEGKGTKGTDGEIGGYWYNQPEYVEVWQEKNDLMEGFDAILEDLHVKIRGNKGYSSFSFLYKCTQELKEFIDRTGIEPENIWILYCGDWDPSGENIDYYLQRRLRQLGLTGIHFIRVAVTPEQIDKYHLPLLSIGQRPGKKAPNPNMREFVRRHGYKATHLNAFFTEAHLPAFKEILRNAVLEHWDKDIYQEMIEEYDVAADAPPRLTEEELSRRRRNMYRKITKTFNDPNWCNGLPDAPDPDDMDQEEDEDDDAVVYPGIDE
jgi:hypothetical protein